MKNIAFLGYDFFFGCVEALHHNGFNITHIFTYDCDNTLNFNTSILAFTETTWAKVSMKRITTDDIIALKQQGVDIIISAAYQYKIPVIDDMPYTINIHPTLLPEGRWPRPLPHIILKELKESGVTIHKVSSEMDAWDILGQQPFAISSNENLETLSYKIQILAKDMIVKLCQNIDTSWSNATPQWEWSYRPLPTRDERTIDRDSDIRTIDKVARAFWKFQCCATWDHIDYVITDLTTWSEHHTYTPWTVVHKMNKELVIAAKNWLVCIRHFAIDPDFQ